VITKEIVLGDIHNHGSQKYTRPDSGIHITAGKMWDVHVMGMNVVIKQGWNEKFFRVDIFSS
jgi:hypothetical protein